MEEKDNTQINLEGMTVVYDRLATESSDLADAILQNDLSDISDEMILRVVKKPEGYFARIYIRGNVKSQQQK